MDMFYEKKSFDTVFLLASGVQYYANKFICYL